MGLRAFKRLQEMNHVESSLRSAMDALTYGMTGQHLPGLAVRSETAYRARLA